MMLAPVPHQQQQARRRCLSCGTTAHMNRKRRYCSMACKESLLLALNRRTGLLTALGARCATFYFTDALIILDILPYGSEQLYSFYTRREQGRAPADDFKRMANTLGSRWWQERDRTHKYYLASRYLLDHVARKVADADAMRPDEQLLPSIRSEALSLLKLGKSDLQTTALHRTIKQAYRRQAKTHHPDRGGEVAVFRRIHDAYESLINWAEKPSFTRRRGFADKWFYEASTNRWIHPIQFSSSSGASKRS